MDHATRARTFHQLHSSSDPLVLFNVWDPGSAKAVIDAGAKAIATGSASVAAALGHSDGEALPLDLVVENARRLVQSTDLPVTIDFEGAYAPDPAGIAANMTRLLSTGVVGINLEDQIVGGEGLYPIDQQVARIAAARRAADEAGVALFINARTDLFLKAGPTGDHKGAMAEACQRAVAYSEAGASGFFTPLLHDTDLIADLCEASPIPVNVMWVPDLAEKPALSAAGVARISHGPFPYRRLMAALTEDATRHLS